MKCLTSPMSLLFLFFSLITFGQNELSSTTSVTSNSEKSILKHTENSKNHKTLLAAMKATNLDEILSQDGPFTVFAPSDMAFRKLSDAAVTHLLKPENKKKLHELVAYHIVAGNLTASKILKSMCSGNGKATFTTVQGDLITATMNGIDIILTDALGNKAKITLADSNQCNGTIHEIDSVILPKKI